MNKTYWDNFYKLGLAPRNESDFARFVLGHIVENDEQHNLLLDVACGNGRDTFFFHKNGIESTGIDLSVKPDSKEPVFIKDDILTFNYSGYNLIYLRFIVHALKEHEFDTLLLQLAKSETRSTLFIETRSSKGVTDEQKSETFFRSPIGEEHFRMLYSFDYLIKKVSQYFDVIHQEENRGLSVFKEDDPVCIRLILKNRV